MADLPLSVSERKRLIQIIARRGAVDTYDRQRNFVENCGLDLISDRLRYGETPDNFAQMLIRESQQAGMIGNPTDHALRQVLQYVREELVAGHPDELLFIDTLLGRSIAESIPLSQSPRPQTAPSLKVASLGTKATTTTPLKTPSLLATRLPISSNSTATAPASHAQTTTSPQDLPFFLLDVWWYGAAFLLFSLGGAAGWLADAIMGWGLGILDYPRYLSQELIVGAGGLGGLVYPVAGALSYPIDRGDYFNSAIEGYLLLLDGFGIAERVAGLLTSLPINLLVAVVLTYGIKLILLNIPGIAELSEATTQSLFIGILAAGWILRWITES